MGKQTFTKKLNLSYIGHRQQKADNKSKLNTAKLLLHLFLLSSTHKFLKNFSRHSQVVTLTTLTKTAKTTTKSGESNK